MNECLFKRHQHTIICILVLLLCPLSFFVPRSATWLLTIGGLFGFVVCKSNVFETFKLPLSLTILALILWGGLSTFWSLDPKASLTLFTRLLSSYMLGIGWCSLLRIQSPENTKLIQFYLLLGIIVAFILISIDYLLGNPWQALSFKTSAKAFVPLALTISIAVWPAVQWLKTKYNSYVVILFVLCASFFLSLIDCDTAPLGLLTGLFVGVLAYFSPKLVSRMGQFLSVILILSLPFVIHSFLTFERIHQINSVIHNFSHIHRLYVWQNVSEKIQQHWLNGYGLDTSRNEALGGGKKSWTMVDKDGKQILINSKEIPMHPHNAPLQWWLELGIVGAILGALLHYQFLSCLSRCNGITALTGIGLFIGSSFIAWINLGFWQSWWLAVLWILAGIFVSSFPEERIKKL
jgi:exopolysaccharide production protein ExoQ